VTYTRESFAAFRVLPWAVDGETLTLRYSLDDTIEFVETLGFPTAVDVARPGVLAAIDLLAAVAGVSYFKVASPHRIALEGEHLTSDGLQLLHRLYDDGLREYAYRNELCVPFETTIENVGRERPATSPMRPKPFRGNILLPMGGGRDSGLLASLLRHRDPTLMSVGENSYVARLAFQLQLRYFVVTRSISPNIPELNKSEAMNGHIPVTAINSLAAIVAALLTDHDTVAMANESSASSPTITLQNGCTINHQYSKSYEAELSMNAALKASKIPVDYFSAVRPYGELAIAKAFATQPELFPLIMSCNRAFVRDPAQRSNGWCGRCAKCRFVFLTLAPFTTPKQLKAMFGRDLLNSADGWDAAGFAALLLEDRPFDCVGEVAEVRLAIGLLAESSEWSNHPGVVSLTELAPPLDRAKLAQSLAPKPEHNVPAEILADVATAFT
jgi:UDP-N-acetyl-alpha-D-muramoyl-L-alanyl-L-glutamate epimerase